MGGWVDGNENGCRIQAVYEHSNGGDDRRLWNIAVKLTLISTNHRTVTA
jgi:hypothetical protein